MPRTLFITAGLALAGCTPLPPPDPLTLPLLGGYRSPADACQGVGESAATAVYLDDAADLVACPAEAENLGVFVTEAGAVQVADLGSWLLYSVPRH